MTREQWKERLPLIQAFAEGKAFQIRGVEGWLDVPSGATLAFDCHNLDIYRIKPELRRLFTAYRSDPVQREYTHQIREFAETYIQAHPGYELVEFVEVQK